MNYITEAMHTARTKRTHSRINRLYTKSSQSLTPLKTDVSGFDKEKINQTMSP